MKVKPVQLVVLIAGVLALGWTTWRLATQDSGPKMADSLRLVDVTTGELFIFPLTGGGAIFPELNPGTGKRLLLPIHEVDGKYRVTPRALGLVPDLGVDPKAIIDRSTGEIKPLNSTWTTISPSVGGQK